MSELRILSLLPSGTEILHALGLGAFQVGRSHECDYPADVLRLPVCSVPAIAVDGSSAEIDALVRSRLAQALSIYQVGAELVAKLRPTHIVTQTQCRVCAVSLDDVEKQIGGGAKVISLEPYSLKDVWSDIRRVGLACDVPERAEDLITEMKARMTPVISANRPRVAALEWLEPVMYAGNWMPELIDRAGGELCSLEDQPDLVLAMPCGFDLARTRAEVRGFGDTPTYLVDGSQYMNRPGPRLVESFRILCEILHSEAYPPTMRDSAWEVFTR